MCRAIVPCCDDPVVSPPDIEDATHGLQKVECEEGELTREFNELSKWQQKNYQTDHVDISRPLEQLPIIVWKSYPIPPYVPLCNMLSNRRHSKGDQTYADPDKYDNNTNGTNERCFCR